MTDTIDPAIVRRAAARAWPRNAHGGGPGLPAHVVEAMAAAYRETGSLAKTAAQFGRTKQAMAYVFKRHGVPLKPRGGKNRPPAVRKHVLLYEARFGVLVLTGAKPCTIRRRRLATPKPGELLEHRRWHGVPYRPGSEQVTICRTTCRFSHAIQIDGTRRSVRIDGVELAPNRVTALALADGFPDVAAFFAYFGGEGGLPFNGVLIGWGRNPIAR